jgi:hypothetical protein
MKRLSTFDHSIDTDMSDPIQTMIEALVSVGQAALAGGAGVYIM